MLSTLPSELIWMIVSLGQLDLQDLMALSLTCKHLKRALSDRPPWISVGKRMQEQGFALPIPSFRTLETLSLQELKNTCIKAKQTKENLNSTLPNFRKHSKMSFDEGASILTSGFLPGGRYLLTFSDQKVAQLWDLDPLLIPSKYSEGCMRAVTRPVASHSTQVDPVTCNFQTHEQCEGETIVAGTVESPSGLSIHVFAFIFEASEGHGVLAKDLCITPPLHSMNLSTLSIYGDVAVVIGSSNETGCLTVVLLDYRRQAIYIIDSGIHYYEQMTFEAFVHESDLIIYTPTPESVVIHAWFYATGLLNSPTATSWSAIHTHPIPPDSTKVWQFEKRCQFPECDWWHPSRPWNTPNPRTRGLIPSHLTADWVADTSPLTTEEFFMGQSAHRPFLAPYWLDPAKVVRAMREEGSLPPAYRTTLRLQMTSFWPPLDEAFPLMTPSSCGQHMVWVASGEAQLDVQKESDGPDLQLIRFPSEKDHANRTGVVPYSRRLVLPLDLKKIHRVDFCDETGVLAVICLGDVPSFPQMLHLFQY